MEHLDTNFMSHKDITRIFDLIDRINCVRNKIVNRHVSRNIFSMEDSRLAIKCNYKVITIYLYLQNQRSSSPSKGFLEAYFDVTYFFFFFSFIYFFYTFYSSFSLYETDFYSFSFYLNYGISFLYGCSYD